MKHKTKPVRSAYGSRKAYKAARNSWRRMNRKNPPHRRSA